MSIFLQLVPFIIQMMKLAEEIFDGVPDSGEKKKEMVIETTRAIASTVEEVSTGGQKETWTVISAIVDRVIDPIVSVFNALGVFKKK